MSHQPRNSRSGYYPPPPPPTSQYGQRSRRQFGGGNNGYPRSRNFPGRGRAELPPLIPIPQHRRTNSTNSSLSSCSSSGGSSLSSRFSSYEDQQKYIDSFEATLAYDNPFNQLNGGMGTFEDEHFPQPFYHYPPPPSRTLRRIQEIRKYDVEKLKTLKSISLEAIASEDESEWLSQMTVDVFRYQSQPAEDYFPEEPFSVASSSSSNEEEGLDNCEFNHHINSLLELISS